MPDSDRLAARTRAELSAGLAPAAARLDERQRAFARRAGLARSMAMLPPLAVVLALLYHAVTLAEAPPFPVYWLPVVLLAAPLAGLLAGELRRRANPARALTAEAARACDERFATQDRLSAAWEFCELQREPARMEAAAILDGRARLQQIDPAEIDRRPPALRLPLGRLLLALLICLLPALLPGRAAADEPAGQPDAPAVAAGEATPGEPEGAAAAATEKAATPRPPTSPAPLSEDPAAAAPPRESAPSAASRGGLEQGAAPSSGGDPRPARSGEPSPSDSSGGAGGQPAQSDTEAGEPPPTEVPRKPATRRPEDRSEQRQRPSADESASSATPGGPARTGGRMAAVGNERSGLSRSEPREAASEEDEEEIEDEDEENDARGGVMPLGRDRNQSASRELSISGDGPPGDGRGGPTPPKKSRGTAALVLGVRLPDRVRGQSNPGTAKTSIEQVPPGAIPAPTAAAAPATGGGAQTTQPQVLIAPDLDAAIRRYHELLRQARQLRRETGGSR